MKILQISGLLVFLLAFGLFNASMFVSTHQLDEKALSAVYNEETNTGNAYHGQALKAAISELESTTFHSNIALHQAFQQVFKKAQANLDAACGADPKNGVWDCLQERLPEGVDQWSYRMGDWAYKDYLLKVTRSSTRGGLIPDHPWLFFFLTIVLAALGGLIYFLPMLAEPAGIKHNGIFQHSATRGISAKTHLTFWIITGLVLLILGIGGKWYFSIGRAFNLLLVILSILTTGLIAWLVWQPLRKFSGKSRSATVAKNGWLSIAMGIYLIGFYCVLYFYPEYMTNWMLLVDPISRGLSGNPASQWFLYGFLYSVIMLMMSIRFLFKYRHNRYQQIRTLSVLFFQLAFAFLIPELLVKFNNPWMDLKTPWPLDYTFFYDYRIDAYLKADSSSVFGLNIGLMMFVWGIILMAIVVPLMTYFYGKRWYCSWVCGCGGLAETLGDPFRQQSDKSLRAWNIERYVIYGVLVVITIMTVLLLVAYTTGLKNYGIFQLDDLKNWYGFLISSAFAGIVGTGFYPIMGNRIWCRFGCPLAALMGIVQRFKSRFRITTNGGQCISCGNCSTYCEMGIDVRWYAQRGQDIVRASCVGCGVCSAVCPRGVLRLENSSVDINERAQSLKALHISMDGIELVDSSDAS